MVLTAGGKVGQDKNPSFASHTQVKTSTNLFVHKALGDSDVPSTGISNSSATHPQVTRTSSTPNVAAKPSSTSKMSKLTSVSYENSKSAAGGVGQVPNSTSSLHSKLLVHKNPSQNDFRQPSGSQRGPSKAILTHTYQNQSNQQSTATTGAQGRHKPPTGHTNFSTHGGSTQAQGTSNSKYPQAAVRTSSPHSSQYHQSGLVSHTKAPKQAVSVQLTPTAGSQAAQSTSAGSSATSQQQKADIKEGKETSSGAGAVGSHQSKPRGYQGRFTSQPTGSQPQSAKQVTGHRTPSGAPLTNGGSSGVHKSGDFVANSLTTFEPAKRTSSQVDSKALKGKEATSSRRIESGDSGQKSRNAPRHQQTQQYKDPQKRTLSSSNAASRATGISQANKVQSSTGVLKHSDTLTSTRAGPLGPRASSLNSFNKENVNQQIPHTQKQSTTSPNNAPTPTLDRFKGKHPKLQNTHSHLQQTQQHKSSSSYVEPQQKGNSTPQGGVAGTKSSTMPSQSLMKALPPSSSTTSAAQKHQDAQKTGSESNSGTTGLLPGQRKVKSASRGERESQQRPSGFSSGNNDKSARLLKHGEGNLSFQTNTQNVPYSTKNASAKITDRPSSASAGQKFIGKAQNLKSLFEQNWQSVNVSQKVDPQSGTQTQIQSLTVMDTNSMVHEDTLESQQLPLQPGTRIVIPNHEPTKCSFKRNGIVRAYAANTNQGLVRNYNEDRVSIILNIVKPEHRQHETWPKCSFFGVYDGHGGSACAEFLRDNLHHFVIKEDAFPWEPEAAIRSGFKKAESKFLEMCQAKDEVTGAYTVIERSGSCAIVVLIVGEICYTANVGDSRAVLSSGGGSSVVALSRDHKPSDTDEYKRIIAAGGQIYQTTTAQSFPQSKDNQTRPQTDPEYIVGPIRVLPGRLSVCRTFGDPEAKLQYRGGNIKVVMAEPDIRAFNINKQHDFIMLASDGIFDKMNDQDVSKCVWLSCEAAKAAKENNTAQNKDKAFQSTDTQSSAISVHQYCGLGVESILKNSLYRQSLDNVTVVMVVFQNFKRVVCGGASITGIDQPQLSVHSRASENVSAKQPSSSTHKSSKFPIAGDLAEKENNINYMNNNNSKSKAKEGSVLQPRQSSLTPGHSGSAENQTGLAPRSTHPNHHHQRQNSAGGVTAARASSKPTSATHFSHQTQSSSQQQIKYSQQPIASSKQSKATKPPSGSNNPQAIPAGGSKNHTNFFNTMGNPSSSGNTQGAARSLSLKEITSSGKGSVEQRLTSTTDRVRQQQMANLRSNKSLGGGAAADGASTHNYPNALQRNNTGNGATRSNGNGQEQYQMNNTGPRTGSSDPRAGYQQYAGAGSSSGKQLQQFTNQVVGSGRVTRPLSGRAAE